MKYRHQTKALADSQVSRSALKGSTQDGVDTYCKFDSLPINPVLN